MVSSHKLENESIAGNRGLTFQNKMTFEKNSIMWFAYTALMACVIIFILINTYVSQVFWEMET